MKNALVLGGGGFIGSAIVRILVRRGGYDITVGDNFVHNQYDDDLKCFYTHQKS